VSKIAGSVRKLCSAHLSAPDSGLGRTTDRSRRRRAACRRGAAGILLLALSTAAGPAGAQATSSGGRTVILGGLDKITATISSLTVPLGGAVAFGTLEVTAQACREPPPEAPPDSVAFLQIRERQDEAAPPVLVFSGWMFASSPGLSALDHPVYDVWVEDCRKEPPRPLAHPLRWRPEGSEPLERVLRAAVADTPPE
jgi:hypothetical protein